jgi:5-methylcytosine-specific restriction endonuclease McrA
MPKMWSKRDLNVHHKKPFSQILNELKEKFPLSNLYEVAMASDELWDINNGITLCTKCHKEVHKKRIKLDNQSNCLV